MAWDLKFCTPDICMYSDASGSWGCGEYWNKNRFEIEWSQRTRRVLNCSIKELFPVVAAAALYGIEWSGKIVCFTIENLAVVHVVQSTYSKEPHLMHLIRFLLLFLISGLLLFMLWGKATRMLMPCPKIILVYSFHRCPRLITAHQWCFLH